PLEPSLDAWPRPRVVGAEALRRLELDREAHGVRHANRLRVQVHGHRLDGRTAHSGLQDGSPAPATGAPARALGWARSGSFRALQVVAASAATRPARLAPARPRHYPTAATLRAEETHDRSHAPGGHRLRAPRGARLPAAVRVQPPRARPRPRPLRRALPVVDGRPGGLLARDGRTAALDDALQARPRLAAAVRAVVRRRQAQPR